MRIKWLHAFDRGPPFFINPMRAKGVSPVRTTLVRAVPAFLPRDSHHLYQQRVPRAQAIRKKKKKTGGSGWALGKLLQISVPSEHLRTEPCGSRSLSTATNSNGCGA